MEIPQRVKKALEGYAIILREERDLKYKKQQFGYELRKFIEQIRQRDPTFTTFSTEHGTATLVEPVKDDIDADALYHDLKRKGLLTPEIQTAFRRVVDKAKIVQFLDELKLPRQLVKKHWTESPAEPYIRVTPGREG
jgi:hypothetical protein